MGSLYWNGKQFVAHDRLTGQGRIAPEASIESLVESSAASTSPNELTGVQPTDFVPIGIGKPLGIRIYTVYVGDLPGGGIFGGSRKDILVVSGVKAAQTFDAVGRAINLLHPKLPDYAYAEFGAFLDGSPIVYYTKSLTNSDVNVSFELTADSFKEETYTKLANLFTQAAGLPVFAPATTYLAAGTVLMKMTRDLGRAFIESAPILRESIRLTINLAGLPDFKEGLYAIVNERDNRALDGYAPRLVENRNGRPVVRLATKSGEEYRGRSPYLIIAIDGREQTQLEDFEPRLATAAILERFYPTSDGLSVLTSELGSALTLYNDLEYKRKAESLRARLGQLTPEHPEYDNLKALFDAYRKNISQDEFKVPDIGE